MNQEPDSRLLLATARADLLDGAGDLSRHGIPDHVAASWRRSLAGGVPPDSVESPYSTELDIESRLVRAARSVIDQLSDQVSDAPTCVALTDSKARILARKDSNSWIGRILDRVYFAQGFGYAEGSVGTNGVGTVLESGQSVHIVGAEHFVDTLQSFACAGAPVRDPYTGRIEGVLDISCLADHSSPIMHSLVRTAARQIERNLMLDRDQSQQALLDMFTRLDARTRDAVVAVGPKVVVANATMQTLLPAEDREALHEHIRFLAGRRAVADELIPLPSGEQVRLRGSTVTVGDDVAGMVGVVTRPREEKLPPGVILPGRAATAPRREVATALTSSTPSWLAAAAAVASGLRARHPVLVLGEPGSGRFSLLENQFRQRGPGGEVVRHDARELDPDRLLTAGPQTLQVLGDVDLLPPAVVPPLLDVLATRPDDGWLLAATASVPGEVDPLLLAAFRDSASVPPLRHRRTDLPGLAAAIVREIAPHRDVRLGDDTLRVLAGYRWPGNLIELRAALGSALTRRPVGEIRPEDLPAYCRTTPRGALRAVDEAERDAIVAALLDADGNRKAAARALGLARSTLYRKIHLYGITG